MEPFTDHFTLTKNNQHPWNLRFIQMCVLPSSCWLFKPHDGLLLYFYTKMRICNSFLQYVVIDGHWHWLFLLLTQLTWLACDTHTLVVRFRTYQASLPPGNAKMPFSPKQVTNGKTNKHIFLKCHRSKLKLFSAWSLQQRPLPQILWFKRLQTLWSLKRVGSVTSLHNFQSSQSRCSSGLEDVVKTSVTIHPLIFC